MKTHTYYVHKSPPGEGFVTIIKRTRGTFAGYTGPYGCFGFNYAIFRNKATEVLIPTHDLTQATKARIPAP